MNKRIRELAEQNFHYCIWEGDGIFTGQVDLEKFAQLIVRECFAMADDFECDVNQRGLVDRMKNHFGIK